MNRLRGALPLLLLLGTAACHRRSEVAFPVVAGPTAAPGLAATIEAQDRRLFDLVFVKEDPEALRALLDDHFSFQHDKWGLVAASPEAFVALIHQTFADRASGKSVEARREVMREEIFPLAQHGAIHQGLHRFVGLHPDGSRTLRETGRFFHVWRLHEGAWKLAQVYSYDHRPAQ